MTLNKNNTQHSGWLQWSLI